MKPWLIEQQVLLSRQISEDILPHALLISGVDGAGKEDLSQWLIQVLLCQHRTIEPSTARLNSCGQCKTCQLFHSNTYPDHVMVSSQTKSKAIGVDDIRKACGFLEKTAYIGHFKTVLIPLAEKMTVAAANALLKTLEEPTPNSIIILLTNDIEQLLPTIISRSRLYTIRPHVGKALLAGLVDSSTQDAVFDQANKFSNLTHLAELSDVEIHQKFESFQESVISYFIDQKEYNGLLKQLNDDTQAVRWLEKIIVNMMRSNHNWLSTLKINDNLVQKFNQSLEHKLNPDKLLSIYQTIIHSNKQEKSYSQINHQFAMEKLLVDIDQIVSG